FRILVSWAILVVELYLLGRWPHPPAATARQFLSRPSPGSATHGRVRRRRPRAADVRGLLRQLRKPAGFWWAWALTEGATDARGAKGIPRLRWKPDQAAYRPTGGIARAGATAGMSEMGASSREMTSGTGDRGSSEPGNRARYMTLKRVAMAAATALVAINIWT